MAKKVKAIVKLQIPAGKATPAPPVGPALGQHGVNIMAFVKEYNERTAAQAGTIVPVEITIFEDRSFTFVTKTPPVVDLLKKAAGIEKGASQPNVQTVGEVTREKIREMAQLIEPGRLYPPPEAVELVRRVSYTSFPGTVEMHVRTNLDPRHADQQIRGVARLPHGLGEAVRVLVFTSGEGIRLAEEAGADFVGGDELMKS